MAGEAESKAVKHIMISYQWDAKKRMIKLRDKLKQEGYNVWMDINNMGGDTLACMGKAVEEAAAVIICVSKKYQESLNCKGEAEYAFKKRKDIIPLKYERGFEATDWLGIVMGAKLYFSVDTEENLDKIFPDLLRELGDKGKLASIEKWSPVKYERSKALDCSICLDRFKNPKTLPCLHSFCEKCLHSWAPQGTETISCPQCRRNIDVPNGDVTQFPTNFHLKELVEEDALREQFTGDGSNGNEFPCTCCDVGKQSRVVARCQNCNLYICTSGLSAHKSQVQGHKVIVFKAAKPEDATQPPAIGQNIVKENAQFEPKSSDWEIFDTMYDEDRSNNLLRYWMQLYEGDTQWQDGMVNHYLACLQRLDENTEISKDTLAQRQQQVAHVFMLAGQYDKAMELVEKALDMELKELGERQEYLADLHYLQSVICEEILRGTSYAQEMDPRILTKCIKHARESLKLRRDLEGNDNKYRLGKVLMVVSSALGYLADYNRLKPQRMTQARKEARKHINEAIEIFTQLKAKGNLASAMKIKANLEEDGSDDQEKLYRDALEMCKEAFGESSVLSERLHWNMSTLFKGRKNFPEAYTWLVKCREICEKIYGQYHPRTQQVYDNLELDEYVDLLKNKSQ